MVTTTNPSLAWQHRQVQRHQLYATLPDDDVPSLAQRRLRRRPSPAPLIDVNALPLANTCLVSQHGFHPGWRATWKPSAAFLMCVAVALHLVTGPSIKMVLSRHYYIVVSFSFYINQHYMHVWPSIGRCPPYDHKLGFEKKEKKDRIPCCCGQNEDGSVFPARQIARKPWTKFRIFIPRGCISAASNKLECSVNLRWCQKRDMQGSS